MVAQKASNVSAANQQIKHTRENIVFFHLWCYGFSQGWKSLYKTIVYMIN